MDKKIGEKIRHSNRTDKKLDKKHWTEKSDIQIDRTKNQTKKSDIKKDRTKDIRHLNRSKKNLIKQSGKNIGQKNRTFN